MGVFGVVVAGVDGTRAGYQAARQAARLVAPGGRLVLAAVADPYLALFNRWGARRLVEHPDPAEVTVEDTRERLAAAAREAVDLACAQVAGAAQAEPRVLHGRPWEALRDLAVAEGADLLAVGSHGTGRMHGIATGSTATELLHEAPCSVLVARLPFDPGRFPASAAAGVDGSGASLTAAEVARDLAGPGARALVAHAHAGDGAVEAAEAAGLPVVRTSRRPADALVEASHGVDLVVVGARGLAGARALGSVSERVAHRAECSVLVVRSA